jgi:NADH:ubiquinone oxidoreductase subunit 6 (subunit J)
MQNFIFYATALAMLACAFRAVTSPYIFRSALYLAATLALTAVQYVLLKAEFVAVVQLLVYVGAVIILIIFAVMLTAQLGEGGLSQTNKLALPAALIAAALGFGLNKLFSGYDWSKVTPAPADPALAASHSNVQAVGAILLDSYVLPFEVIALLLFTALVGAVLIARKEPAA